MQREPEIIDVFSGNRPTVNWTQRMKYKFCDMKAAEWWRYLGYILMTWFCMLHSIFWSLLIGSGLKMCHRRLHIPSLVPKVHSLYFTQACRLFVWDQRCVAAKIAITDWMPWLLLHPSHVVVTVTAAPAEGRTWLRWECVTGAQQCVDTGPIDLLYQASTDTETWIIMPGAPQTPPPASHSTVHCTSAMISYCTTYQTCQPTTRPTGLE